MGSHSSRESDPCRTRSSSPAGRCRRGCSLAWLSAVGVGRPLACGTARPCRRLGTVSGSLPAADEAADLGMDLRELLYGRRRGVYRILFTIDGSVRPHPSRPSRGPGPAEARRRLTDSTAFRLKKIPESADFIASPSHRSQFRGSGGTGSEGRNAPAVSAGRCPWPASCRRRRIISSWFLTTCSVRSLAPSQRSRLRRRRSRLSSIWEAGAVFAGRLSRPAPR